MQASRLCFRTRRVIQNRLDLFLSCMRIDGILLPLHPLPHHHPIPLLLTVFAFFFLRFLYVRVDIPPRCFPFARRFFWDWQFGRTRREGGRESPKQKRKKVVDKTRRNLEKKQRRLFLLYDHGGLRRKRIGHSVAGEALNGGLLLLMALLMEP